MRLTGRPHTRTWATRPWLAPRWAAAVTALGLVAAFLVDWRTGSLPLQHLYYLPVVLAALHFGRRGAWASSLSAIALYHVANPQLRSLRHEAPDVVQVLLFLAIGLVTARLRDDALRLEALAGTDDLTGLLNLRSFEVRLREALGELGRRDAVLSMVVLDLDGLKALNDAHGHLAGAESVRVVGGLIAEVLPAGAAACRYGGDEFAIALPGLDERSAQAVASELLERVRRAAPVLAGKRFPAGTLSVSLGIATLREAPGARDVAEVGESLFRAADAALYEAKRSGRGRFSIAPAGWTVAGDAARAP